MFSLRTFVKSGLMKAVGSMADYQVILNAAGWLEKGVLTESDLEDIQTAIERREMAEKDSENPDSQEEPETGEDPETEEDTGTQS